MEISPIFSRQPKDKRMEFIKKLVSQQQDEQRGCEDWGPPLSLEEVECMQGIISVDYAEWVKVLRLSAVPLDVYGFCKSSEAKTPHGTSVTNGTPGYDGNIIVMPLWPKTTREQGMELPAFPPGLWNEELPAWPEWRTNLLHEIMHQLEDQILHIWSGKENPHTYYKALEEAVARLNSVRTVTLDELRMLTWPQVVEQMKLSSNQKNSVESKS